MSILVPRKISAAHSWFSLIISQDFPSSGRQPNLGPKWHSVAHHLSYWQQWSHWQQGGGGLTESLNINKREVQIKGGVWKLFSVKSGNALSLIMVIAFHGQLPAWWLLVTSVCPLTCLPLAFLMFNVFSFQEKWECLHS